MFSHCIELVLTFKYFTPDVSFSCQALNFSAEPRNSAVFADFFVISEISENLVRKKIGRGGVRVQHGHVIYRWKALILTKRDILSKFVFMLFWADGRFIYFYFLFLHICFDVNVSLHKHIHALTKLYGPRAYQNYIFI